MRKVEWKFDGLFKADAERVYDEIQEIGDSYTADDILEKAKDENTELHKCFDWDDSIAAYKWRRHTARQICTSLVLKVVESEHEPPKKFRVIQNTREGDGYEPSVRIYANPRKMNILLERMKEDSRRFIDRYKSLPEASEIILAMEEVI